MKKQAERIVFQSRMTAEQLDKLRKIAVYRGTTMSSVLFGWIDAAYARLPKEAQ